MKKSFLKVLALVSFVALPLLYGCSSENKSSGEHPAASAGAVLNKGNGAEPESLDPSKNQDIPGLNILNDLFEGLLVEAPDNTMVPGVAERWDISADGKTYTFHLRHDAKWSNGEPVTADDFVYGIRRAVSPQTAGGESYLFYSIQNAQAINAGAKIPVESLGVKALDQYTVEIKLKAPTPYFLQLMGFPIAFPVYKPNVDQYGDKFTQPGHLVSNGAYQLKDWVVNDHITLVRNPQYWDNAHTAIDTVNYYPTPDTAAEFKQYQAGQLDYTYLVTSDGFQELKKQYPTELHTSPYAATFYYLFNLTRGPFKDHPELRQALSMIIDREAIANSVVPIGIIPQYNLVPKGIVGVDTDQVPDWVHWPMKKRIEEAQKLYAKAGYSKDHPLKITILSKNSDLIKNTLVAVQAMWHDALGMNVELRLEEWKSFLSDFNGGQFDVGTVDWVGDYDEPSAFLGLLTCRNPQNPSKYCDSKYDQLMNEAAKTTDDNKRKQLYDQANQIVMNAYPKGAIYQDVALHLVKPYVGGYQQTQLLDHVHSKNWHIIPH